MIFIAEIGLNHNGDFNSCYKLIKKAKIAGADIVKFQLGWRDKPGEINHINFEKLKKLHDWANEINIEIMFSVFHKEALDLLLKFKPKKIKIASRTVADDLNFVRNVVSLKLKTFISLGMWQGKDLPIKSENISYLYCVSKYPALDDDLTNFPKNFSQNYHAGYSDHTIGIDACLLAISRGANIIEKHFTLDKKNKTIRDHLLSAEPDEFATLVDVGSKLSKKIKKNI